MRLIIFTNRDIASNLFLNHVLRQIAPYVVHIFVSDKVGKTTTADVPKELKDLKFFEQTLPNTIVFPLLDAQKRANTEGGKLMTFNELSRFYDLPIESLNDVRSAESLAKIEALEPDLVLSVRYGKIFGNAFLKIPKRGVINLHSGRLPQYRGVLPTFRALMNGDTELYPTLHYIEDGTIDTGGIIGSVAVPVQDKCLLGHILDLYPHSVALVASTIHQIAQGQKPLSDEQPQSDAAYFTFPTHVEIDAFLEKTKREFVDVAEYMALLNQYV